MLQAGLARTAFRQASVQDKASPTQAESVVTITWITEEDRGLAAQVRRRHIARDELMTLFSRWLLGPRRA
jgi:hypothetical protein